MYTCIMYFTGLGKKITNKKKGRPRTNFEADLWPETETFFFWSLAVRTNILIDLYLSHSIVTHVTIPLIFQLSTTIFLDEISNLRVN